MNIPFELKLIDQYWLPVSESSSRDPNGCPEDTTSHGKIELCINGQDISGCDNQDTDYGINQSAVKLLQTVFIDHDLDKTSPLFFHGCSILGTCPNCIIDFKVNHISDDKVVLDHFYVSGSQKGGDSMSFYDKSVCLSNIEYAKAILSFARKALEFLPIDKKSPGLEHEVEYYKQLRIEHKELISLVEKYLQECSISQAMKERAASFEVV
ncbi:MAG: hypothetical protein GWN67_05695 [Phycisphaerae bacterium]|nr:hypothetical protein [Phycisphaerae bacterium]NIP51452.1 hypothetical protein [Phycisphaerae bacterium]NIS50656.1 hypothetical protein [Phycisphaerae bacterium]NIU08389.1 hypothetical protein [Phycisphaerae bacterium]NIU55888.1 hypothetical protein [Phycisphaerae bacterium]